MRRTLILLSLVGLSACVEAPVQPSPTSDQVLAAQYRARGELGQMSGMETQKLMDAYARDIARPAESRAEESSNFDGGLMHSR